jgi:hypothetical protein
MKGISGVLAASMAALSTFPIAIDAKAMSLPAQAVRDASAGLSLFVPVRCFKYEFVSDCETICTMLRTDKFWSLIWTKTDCVPGESEVNKKTCKTNSPNTVMSKITSCKAGPASPGGQYGCMVTVCGVIDAALSPRINRTGLRPPQVKQPVAKPKVGPGPGLLEGDAGFGAQGPARAGVGGGGASGGGGGVGVSTFRSPSNMTAPPAGGGLR